MSDFDAVIVGAGAVGLACAYALAQRGLGVAVLERENRIGAGVSSRNSEVIHAGIHYTPGSLKARLCVKGRRALYSFAASHGVAYQRCEKLVVATDPSEIAAIEALARRGEENGVEGLRLLSAAEARALEPQLRVAAALHSRESGVIDAHALMVAMLGEIETRSGVIALNTPFRAAEPCADGFRLWTGGEDATTITSQRLVISAGLSAQACARAIEGYPRERAPQQFLGKGSYFWLTGVAAPFARLIYPPPIPGALGTHYRRDLGGVARFGPDLQWVDAEDYKVDPARAVGFYETVRRFWPGLPDGALAPDYAGVRPKIHGPHEPQVDFMIDDPAAHGVAGLACLFGIESPGLTSCLAIGEDVAARLVT